MSIQTDLSLRISSVHEALREASSRTEQEWADEIFRHSQTTFTALTDIKLAEEELIEWEIIAFAYSAFFEARTPFPKARDQALKVLMDCRAGRSEIDIHKAAYKALTIAEIKSLMEHYSVASVTVHTISKMKNNH